MSASSVKGLSSGLLEKLGVRSVAIVEHGPDGKRCGAALVAALAIAVGCSSPAAKAADELRPLDGGAVAAVSKQFSSELLAHGPSDVLTAKAGKTPREIAFAVAAEAVGATPGDSTSDQAMGVSVELAPMALNATAGIARLASSVVVGSAVGAVTGDEGAGQQAAGIVTAVASGVMLGPVVGGYFVYDQAKDTYSYVQEQQKKNVELKLAEVSARTAKVHAEEVLRIRLQERVDRQSQANQGYRADQAQMLNLVEELDSTGLIDPQLQARVKVEEIVEKAGYSTESWYSKYKSTMEGPSIAALPGIRGRFLAGLETVNAGVDAQQWLDQQEQPRPTSQGMR